jgi:hypothetical protein
MIDGPLEVTPGIWLPLIRITKFSDLYMFTRVFRCQELTSHCMNEHVGIQIRGLSNSLTGNIG